ncbi:MAG: hypothetical protein WDO56_14875 [Gammaproteobacteria bacterium]
MRLVCLLLIAIGSAGLAAGAAAETVPLKVVEGHLVVGVSLSNAEGESNDVMLEVSLERPEVLVLHGDQHEWLKDGASVGLLLKPDLQVALPANEVVIEARGGRERIQNELTRMHSNETGELPVKGTLGTGFLRRYRVVLDVAGGTMTLTPPGAAPRLDSTLARSFELREGRAWLPLRYADGKSGQLLLGSENYDTLIDSQSARDLGKAAGDIGPVRLGRESETPPFDLAQDLAFRPRLLADDDDKANDGALLVSGVNLLEIFRVEIDWSASRIAFTRRREIRYPRADLEFFQAEVAAKPEGILAWLQRYPQSRLSAEAAAELMQLRIEQSATDDEVMQALQWVVDTAPVDRRLESCMQYVRTFVPMPGKTGLVERAGALALKYSRSAATVQDTYRLHNLIGEAFLKDGELTEAWKHFLSAAFMPLDNESDLVHNLSVNLNLARVYDRQQRFARAYSRYRRARDLMNVKGRDRPSLIDLLSHAPDESTLTPEARQLIESARIWKAEIDTAMARLRTKIPPDNRVLLDG